jgi:hypothetical protein
LIQTVVASASARATCGRAKPPEAATLSEAPITDRRLSCVMIFGLSLLARCEPHQSIASATILPDPTRLSYVTTSLFCRSAFLIFRICFPDGVPGNALGLTGAGSISESAGYRNGDNLNAA